MQQRCLLLFALVFLWTAGALTAHGMPPNRPRSGGNPDQAYGANIHLIGTSYQIARLAGWLDLIARVPKGRATLQRIAASGHRLVIRHADYALLSAGRTLAPMTENLINGKGESVSILFCAHIDDRGSHMVFNDRQELIEFTAVQNLYHELAHAMHQMNGTWRYFDSEGQAIEEENIFRRQLAILEGKPPTERFRKAGIRITGPRKVSTPPGPLMENTIESFGAPWNAPVP
jgi:hypothetical protein